MNRQIFALIQELLPIKCRTNLFSVSQTLKFHTHVDSRDSKHKFKILIYAFHDMNSL